MFSPKSLDEFQAQLLALPQAERFRFIKVNSQRAIGDKYNRAMACGIRINNQPMSIVFDTRSWQQLAVLPTSSQIYNSMNTDLILKKAIDQACQQNANIYQSVDGTVLTAYRWYDNVNDVHRWGLATTYSYDLSTLSWTHSDTYAQLTHEAFIESKSALAKVSGICMIDGYLNFTNLPDSVKWFTFGLRHPKIHPEANSIMIWSIPNCNPNIMTPHMSSLNKVHATSLTALLSVPTRYGFIVYANDGAVYTVNSKYKCDVESLFYQYTNDPAFAGVLSYNNRWVYQILRAIKLNTIQHFTRLSKHNLESLINAVTKNFNQCVTSIVSTMRSRSTLAPPLITELVASCPQLNSIDYQTHMAPLLVNDVLLSAPGICVLLRNWEQLTV